jgi:DNA-binding GntR family transcriptional regulator
MFNTGFTLIGPLSRDGDERTGRHRGELQNRVLAELRHGLIVGAFVPGQTITLRRLAELLGTSPMPVRKALNELTAAGVLTILPNRSVAVPRMSPERLRELIWVRQVLEGRAAELACQKATPALLRQLTKVNTALHKAIRARDILVCLSKNQEFHFVLYAAAHSEVLPPLIESLWLQGGPIMYLSLTSPDMPWDASCHDAVLAALKEKSPAGVRRAIERDITTTGESLLRSSAFRGRGGPLTAIRRAQ